MVASRRASGRGFTLLELLVSIGIISILVGISVPSFARAMRMARTYNCQSRLLVLHKAMVMYASQNFGSFPAGPIESTYYSSPDQLFYLDPNKTDPNKSSKPNLGWYSLGVVWRSGFVNDGTVFYCPEGEYQGRPYSQCWPASFDPNGNPAPSDPSKPNDVKTTIYSGYAYRGGLANAAGKPEGIIGPDRMTTRLGLIADTPIRGSFWHRNGYNVVYADGSIDFKPFDQPAITDGKLQDFWQAIKAWTVPQ